MNFAAIDWLSISINLLLVVFVIICLLMTLIILMQRPKQEGLGAAFGAGVTDQVFGARTTNVLQRGTVYLGSLFFILSLTLAVLIGQKNKKIELAPVTQAAKVEETTPAATEKENKPKSLSEELPVDANAPATIPAPVPDASVPEALAPVAPQAEPAPADSVPAAEPTTPVAPPAAPAKPSDAVAPADGSGTSEDKPGQP